MRGATAFRVAVLDLGLFQSTRPMRGATSCSRPLARLLLFQSTRPMRGATNCSHSRHADDHISIHAPHAGRDTAIGKNNQPKFKFQSTRPMRGATIQEQVQG